MSVMLRWTSRLTAVCLGTVCLAIGAASPVHAQAVPANPLRASAAAPGAPAPANAVAEPVRLAAHAEQLSSDVRGTPPTPARSYRPAAQPAAFSYGSRAPRPVPRGFVPRHERVLPTQATEELTVDPLPDFGPGDIVIDGPTAMPDAMLGPGRYGVPTLAEGDDCAACGGSSACGACGGCDMCCGCLLPCPLFALSNVEFFAGTQAFSGPLNRGETASFGFHYGLNWGVPVPCMPNEPIGMQIGYRGVSSNYSGASFTEDSRDQSFITAGLFRRVDWGLQGGLVVDILSDKWYYDNLSLTQLRGELSWVFPQCHELGAFFTAGTRTDDAAATMFGQMTLVEQWEPTDMFAFFYRRRFETVGGGYARGFGGFTGDGGGLVGADFDLPLTESWALRTNFTYLIPKDGNNRVAYLDEAWNVGISLVWCPGRRKAVGNDYFRPLLDVADNGVFIPRRSGH